MRWKPSKYPIGATWELIADGRRGVIWLAEVSDYGFEIWRWSVCYVSDGSGTKFDWCTSYASCKKEIPMTGTFKRVK